MDDQYKTVQHGHYRASGAKHRLWVEDGFRIPLALIAALLAAVSASAGELTLTNETAAPSAPNTGGDPASSEGSTRNPDAINATFVTMETLDDSYKLLIGDRLSFRILEDLVDTREPLEARTLVVTDSGSIEVPYIGRFPSEGKTCKELAWALKAELERDYYRKATVIIGLDQKTKSSGKVYVAGQVRLPGPIEIPGKEILTVSKAILYAGGLTADADKRHVKVTRNKDGPEGQQTRSFLVDLREIVERGRTDQDLRLEPGDSIFVPTKLTIF